MNTTWVTENGAFGDRYRLPSAIDRARLRRVAWDDSWWNDGRLPQFGDGPVVFHGSLGNAARLRREAPWRPGAFCDVEAFRCLNWYGRAEPWLVNRGWRESTVAQLIAEGVGTDVFVRPDSALKPFSGRVLRAGPVTLGMLDHGFYFDDVALPVIVAPRRRVGREWRYVVVDGRVVAGSGYTAEGRRAVADDPTGPPWGYAAKIAASLLAPESVYVLDVCEVNGALALLELNPFSGADLYACDPDAVVRAVTDFVGRR